MEKPIPIYCETPEGDSNENSFKFEREYIMVINNNKYKLKLNADNKFINFIFQPKGNLIFFQYKNKFKYEAMIEVLKLNKNSYNNYDKIIDYLDKLFKDNKFEIIFQEYSNIFNITFNLLNDCQGYRPNIILKKEEITNSEKFDALFDEIKLLKQDLLKKNKIINESLEKIKYLNKLNNSYNKKINESENIIKLLKNKIQNNENIMKQNENEIKNLNNEISNLKDMLKKNKKNKNELKKNKKNKNELKKDKINKEDNEINEKENNNNKGKNIDKNNSNQNNSENDFKIEKNYFKENSGIDNDNCLNFKIIFLGACMTGKTSINQNYLGISLFLDPHPHPHFNNTLIKINDTLISLLLIDCPGQEKYRSYAFIFGRTADFFVFVYSVSNESSFDYAIEFLVDVKKQYNNSHYALIGCNKTILDKIEVSGERAEEFVQNENLDFFMEVCIEPNYNIDNLFFEIVKILYKTKASAAGACGIHRGDNPAHAHTGAFTAAAFGHG